MVLLVLFPVCFLCLMLLVMGACSLDFYYGITVKASSLVS